jgi:hypothetical protein
LDDQFDDEKSMLIRVKVYFDTVFDIRWYWASNVFIFIGGGSAVIRSMVFTIIADVVPEEHRYGHLHDLCSHSTKLTMTKEQLHSSKSQLQRCLPRLAEYHLRGG